MPNRQTGIGLAFRADPILARLELERVIRRNHGNMTQCAADLGIHRRQFFRLVHRTHLWRLVWTERRRAATPQPWK